MFEILWFVFCIGLGYVNLVTPKPAGFGGVSKKRMKPISFPYSPSLRIAPHWTIVYVFPETPE